MNNFEIWHGNHNRFILFFNIKEFDVNPPFQGRVAHRFFNKKTLSKSNIIKLCKKHNAEGLSFLELKSNKKLIMKFFNPDGSRDNCGNALRVCVFATHTKGLVENNGTIYSFGRSFRYNIIGEEVKVEFSKVWKINNCWNIGGVIHKVIIVDSLENFKTKASSLRKKHRANITFVKKINQGIFAQTFETGVEDFTAACGTGSIAAALETGESKIFMPGGLLKVEKTNSGISLTGRIERLS